MDERNNEADKLDEVLLPGFRFHPTDEELVGFYLKRKIQQRPLSIELIKQLDIYKYDPWDLPKLATTGEREWYFYCPRDRKYRNSARPNRVTGAGFWKATGTDRPIYSSEGTKCIGLKKSLVFYKGKAAKGIKTDWMMHEFRLPSLTDSMPSKRFTDHKNNIPANDSWAICRIFKKTNSSAQRALSHSWVSPLPETNTNASDLHAKEPYNNTHFGSENMSILTAAKTSTAPLHFNYNDDLQHSSTASTTTTSSASFSPLDYASYKALNSIPNKLPPQLPMSAGDLTTPSFMFSPFETSCTSAASKCNIDVSSMLLNMSSSMLGDFGKAGSECLDFGGSQEQQQCSGFSTSGLSHHQMQVNINNGDHENVYVRSQNVMHHLDDQWDGSVRSIGFPFSLPMSLGEAWKASSLWDSSSCPSEMSTIVSTKCYT